MRVKFNSNINLYQKFVGFLTKKGYKNKAKKVVDQTFFDLSKKIQESPDKLLISLFKKLNVFVEAKTVRIRRRTHVVPFSIGLKRRSYLVIKWLMKAVGENKKRTSTASKITEEILSLMNGTNSKVLKYRTLNNAQALANRANMHYRW